MFTLMPIQSFAPGEATPKQAYEISMKLAEEVLGGKYEFVLSAHIEKDISIYPEY